jgi:hypothetical protein
MSKQLTFKPIYVQFGESDPKPVRSTGNFGALGKQSSAQSPEEALNKSSTFNIPAGYEVGSVKLNTIPIGWIVKYRTKAAETHEFSAGKRRQSRKGKKKRPNKTRRRRRQ